MQTITIDGYLLSIDIAKEVSDFDWRRARWSEEKLIAASPFRDDARPSFFVDLTTGGWADSGADDEEFRAGNLAKLLSFLRNETYEESLEYLIELYGKKKEQTDRYIEIPSITLREKDFRIELPESTLEPYHFRHPYLDRRGINERTQRFAGIGYDRGSQAITIPWRHPDGKLANIKFRKVSGKLFWYEKGAAPVRTLVYGIDKVYKHELKEVVVCEAEIDALSWYSSGKPAIALGGTTVTEKQLEIIRKSPIEELTLAMDNDSPGKLMEGKLTEGLSGYVSLNKVEIPSDYKDSNEALTGGIDLKKLKTFILRWV